LNENDGERVAEPPTANTGTIRPGSPLDTSVRAVLEGSRWLVAEGEPVATAAVIAALESAGCIVRSIDAEGRRVPLLGPFDAQIVLSDTAQDARLLGERLRLHPGLRWASILRFAWSSLWRPGESAPTVALLATRATGLLEAERALRELVRTGPARFTPSVETLGPVRTLRALSSGEVLRVCFAAAEQQGRVEVGGGLVLNATHQGSDGRVVAGEEAFAAVLELAHAEVTVERRDRPEALTLVAPLEEALALAMMSRPPRFDAVQPPRLAHDSRRGSVALASRPAPQPRVAANTMDDRTARSWPARALAGALLGASLGLAVAYQATRDDDEVELPEALATTRAPEAGVPLAAPAAGGASAPTPAPAVARPPVAPAPAARLAEPPAGAGPRELAEHARAALAAGDTLRAVRWAELAVEQRKRRADYRLLYGDALAADGQRERALRQYSLALARRPGDRAIVRRIEALQERPGS
jgi:hypothetical protein